ncbi:MAG: acyl-CoA thioesterase [Bacteroidota bacterium]
MHSHNIAIRVRYAETDRMGYVYYGNYATYFEVARVEWLRTIGISYKELEDSGIALPVSQFNITYLKPALYDQLLTITVQVQEVVGAKIFFKYETRNEAGELINQAETTLVFFDRRTNKPCAPPKIFSDAYNGVQG